MIVPAGISARVPVFTLILFILFPGCASLHPSPDAPTAREVIELLGKGDVPSALEAAREAVSAAPSDVEAHLAYQEAMVKSGRGKELLEEYRRLREDNRESALHVFLFANVHPDPLKKRAMFRSAVGLDPGFTWAYRALLGLLRPPADEEEILDALCRLVELETDNAEVRRRLALALFRRGDFDRAFFHMKKLFEADSRNPAVKEEFAVVALCLARKKLDSGENAVAADLFRRILALYPDNRQARLGLCDKALADRNSTEALDWARRAGRADYREARAHLLAGDEKKAVECLKKAVERKPSHAPAWKMLAELRLKNNDRQGALDALLSAVAADPGDADALYELARLADDTGDDSTAATAWEKYLGVAERGTARWRNAAGRLIEIEKKIHREMEKTLEEVDELVKKTRHVNEKQRQTALFKLNRLLGKRAAPYMKEAAKSKYLDVRLFAVRSLGLYGLRSAIPYLVEALQDKNSEVRKEAADSIAALGPGLAPEALVKTLRDEDSSVRTAALRALGKISKKDFRYDPAKKPERQEKSLEDWDEWLESFEKKLEKTGG